MSDLVMGYLTLGDLDPFEMVRAAGEGGFKASGIRLTGHRPGDAWPFDPQSEADIARMRAVLAQAGVRLVNACTYRVTADVDPAVYRPVLSACSAFGIGTLICNSFATEEMVIVSKLAAIADLAAPFGIRLALEFIAVSAVKSIEQAARIAAATGRDNVGLVIDALHLWRSGGSPVDLEAVDPSLFLSVQLCDGPLQAPIGDALYTEMRGGRLMPGQGAFDLRGLLRALPRDIEVEVEAPNTAYAGLPPAKRARVARVETEAFLATLQAEASA
jgi:sugar phosphate isomerase/epimerase